MIDHIHILDMYADNDFCHEANCLGTSLQP